MNRLPLSLSNPHAPSATRTLLMALILSATFTTACDEPRASEETKLPEQYAFASRFTEGESGVSYTGQTMRQALLSALIGHIEGLNERLLMGFMPSEGDLLSELELFYDCPDDLCVAEAHKVELSQPLKQQTLGDISSGKNLSQKVAGQDEVGQHKDWSLGVQGWGESELSPDALVRSWFELIELQARQFADGEAPVDPSGVTLSGPHITPEGLNLAELTEKFLYGALAFSQAADDYLDDDIEGKGLLSDHVADDGGYTALEHAWDEGFGYFGAARDLPMYSLEELAGSGGRPEYQSAFDSDQDGEIDLRAEYNWSAARYAAKRDRDGGSRFAERAFEAFLKGRALISAADGALSSAQLTELKGYRDQAIQAWEATLAASAVHYLNKVLTHLDQAEAEWSFEEHATHWSELKGFALSFQFNPRSALSDEDFERVHEAIGLSPTLPSAEGAESHREALISARSLLGERFSFTEEQLSGW